MPQFLNSKTFPTLKGTKDLLYTVQNNFLKLVKAREEKDILIFTYTLVAKFQQRGMVLDTHHKTELFSSLMDLFLCVIIISVDFIYKKLYLMMFLLCQIFCIYFFLK